MSNDEIELVLKHIISGDRRNYSLIAATVMPDHVHLLLRPDRGADLSQIMKGIKGVSARLLNTLRGQRGSLWQDESWDRIVRDQAELDEKLAYMLDNPVRKGLTQDPREWPGFFLNQEAN